MRAVGAVKLMGDGTREKSGRMERDESKLSDVLHSAGAGIC